MATAQALNFRFLRASQVQLLNAMIEGASSYVRDETMLASAVDSPINQQHYGENDPARLAAALSYKLIKNHAFANGNKRTALLAANLFLLHNGKLLQQNAFQVESNDAITRAHIGVATGDVEESELADLYRNLWQNATSAHREQAASLSDA